MPIDTDKVALLRADSQIDLAVLGLVQKRAIEPGEPVVIDFAGELLLHFQFTLPPELTGDEIARPCPNPVGDIVAGDVEDLALIGDAADHDMGVRVTGVVMVDRDPIEGGVNVPLHLSHQPARERLQVAECDAILGTNDESELVTVLSGALGEIVCVNLVLQRRVGVPTLTVQCDAFPLKIAQMGGDSLALNTLELHYSRLDDHAAGSVSHPRAQQGARIELPAAVAFQGGSGPTPPSTRIEATPALMFPCCPRQAPKFTPLLSH